MGKKKSILYRYQISYVPIQNNYIGMPWSFTISGDGLRHIWSCSYLQVCYLLVAKIMTTIKIIYILVWLECAWVQKLLSPLQYVTSQEGTKKYFSRLPIILSRLVLVSSRIHSIYFRRNHNSSDYLLNNFESFINNFKIHDCYIIMNRSRSCTNISVIWKEQVFWFLFHFLLYTNKKCKMEYWKSNIEKLSNVTPYGSLRAFLWRLCTSLDFQCILKLYRKHAYHALNIKTICFPVKIKIKYILQNMKPGYFENEL